jgi:two-component system phosphate regulon sensor histidine kinase PhoR
MPPPAHPAWTGTITRIALLLALALAIGLPAGQPWMALALAALAALAWQAWKLRTLLSRLEGRQRVAAIEGGGAWDALDRLLHRDQQDFRAQKRRLVAMLRAYRALADALPDAVIVAERDSQRIAWFNAASTRLLGLHYPDDIEAPLGERLQPLPIAHWLSAGRMAEPLSDIASPLDPTVRLSLRLVPYSEDLWLLIVRDVSRITRLEQMRRDFVANVSHELRTPLTVVHGYLEMLDEGGLDPADQLEWAPMLAEMRRQSQRMTPLVEDLLTLSRLEARDTLDEEPVSMASMLATLRREAEALSQGRHAITVEDDAGVDLTGSIRELHSAFSNLVSNAVRYTPAGGSIVVRFARSDDGGAVLSVRDSGYGIPATHLPRLTERFYRVSTSRSRESGGTGLGLAIVKHVLGLHEARLEIDSEVGRGSVFSCVFGPGRVHPRGQGEWNGA